MSLINQPLEYRPLPAREDVEGLRRIKRDGAWSYRMKMGRETIWLDSAEYCVVAFLASRPYRAFTRGQIAQGASTPRQPITEGSVDGIIQSLRRKLGFFHDYIQTVPYVGYRFRE